MQILLSTLFINFRFAVMSFALVPHLKRVRTAGLVAGAQLLAVSPFAVSFLRFQRRSNHDNFIYFLGVAIPSYICYLAGTVVGYYFGARIPAGFEEGISFIFPAYLAALLGAELRERRSIAVVGVAFLATPVVEALVPGWGLILNAIGVATAAIGAEAWWESASPSSYRWGWGRICCGSSRSSSPTDSPSVPASSGGFSSSRTPSSRASCILGSRKAPRRQA